MRIVAISDTHGQHEAFTKAIPECDLLIHSGDFMALGEKLQEIVSFNEWLGRLPCRQAIVVAGNHEVAFEKKPQAARGSITNAIYLQDSGVTVNGLRIWGSPVQPRFYDWAFNRDRGDDIKRHWDLIPLDTDVLITHGPPHGILDRSGGTNCGCEQLLLAVRRVKPALHIFGHIHAGHGSQNIGGTQFVNAAVVNEQYAPAYGPVTIDLDLGTRPDGA